MNRTSTSEPEPALLLLYVCKFFERVLYVFQRGFGALFKKTNSFSRLYIE